MTSAEYETIIREAAKENDELKDRIQQLEDDREKPGRRSGPSAGHEPDDNPLCRGCYHWRMAAAGMAGLGAGYLILATFRVQPMLARSLAATVTGNKDYAGLLQAVLVIFTVFAPGLATFIEWKWMNYKDGDPGIFRVIVAIREALKKGQTNHE